MKIPIKETKCGFQPFFQGQDNKSYTIEKNEWSLHLFPIVFGRINSSRLTIMATSTKKLIIHGWGKWATSHLKNWNSSITRKTFNLDLDFCFRHQSSHETQPLEPLNVLTELIIKVQETHSNWRSLHDHTDTIFIPNKGHFWKDLRILSLFFFFLRFLVLIFTMVRLFLLYFQAMKR